MSSGGNSISSNGGPTGLSTDPDKTYTVNELAEKLKLDEKVVKWLRERPFDPEDPVVVLNFKQPFTDQQVPINGHVLTLDEKFAEIGRAMVRNNAEMKAYNAFFFKNQDLMFHAHDEMMVTHPWAFSITAKGAALLQSRGFDVHPEPQKIETTVILSATAANSTVTSYQFFDH